MVKGLIPVEGEIIAYSKSNLSYIFVKEFFEKLGYEFLGEYKDNSYIIKTPKGEEENLMKKLTEKYSQFFEKSSLRYSKLDKRFEFIANLENLVQNLNESVEETNFSDKLKEISNYIQDYED